jgi:hypothetical protein
MAACPRSINGEDRTPEETPVANSAITFGAGGKETFAFDVRATPYRLIVE